MRLGGIAGPREVFPMWGSARRAVVRHAREPLLPPSVLRTTGLLGPDAAARVSEWFTAIPAAPTGAVLHSYRALERDTAQLFAMVRRRLGVRVRCVRTEHDLYAGAAELCAELREHRSMALRTIACEAPHPLLGGTQGGVIDQLRVVHDVHGHAALGVGFDLQSEFATWLQCRTLSSADARPAAFCKFVGALTAYVVHGEKPALRAGVPPAEILAATGRSPVSRNRTPSGLRG